MLKKNADKDTLVRTLRSASQISSDGEKCAVLTEAAQVYVDDAIVRKAFFDAAGTVSSDGERHRALSALLEESRLERRHLARSGQVGFAHVLRRGKSSRAGWAGRSHSSKHPEVWDALATAANTISSDGEHCHVLMAALNSGTLGADSVVLIVHSAEKINSDGEKARVLARVAQRYSNDPQVVTALRTQRGPFNRTANIAA